jgi:elongation factor 2
LRRGSTAEMSKKFTGDDVKSAMQNIDNVRNILMVGPMGVGKTCGMDCLGAQCGLVAEEKIGETRFTHTRPDERDKGCTIKSSLTTMIIDDLLVHALDTPGHTEYSGELSIVAPLADGAFFVVDGSRGDLAPQVTKQVKMANDIEIAPLLFCNRLDISLLVTKKPADEILDELMQLVEAFNQLCLMKPDATTVSAEKGSVMFGSLLHGWGFTIPHIAGTYSKKFGSDIETMSARLWGENYFNPKKKTWTKSSQDGSSRAFVTLIITPIMKILEACEGGDVDKVEKMMAAMGVTFSAADKKFTGVNLFHRAMQLWMPAGPCMASAFRKFVPNPAQAQAKRAPVLISGPMADPACAAVKECSTTGQLLFQVAKLVPQPSAAGRFFALGRVFSGTMGADKCYLLEEDYVPKHAVEDAGKAADSDPFAMAAPPEGEAAEEDIPDAGPEGSESPGGKSPAVEGGYTPKAGKSPAFLQERRIQGVVFCQAGKYTAVSSVPCGNLCAISGIDQFILKRATVAGSKDAFPLRKPTLNVSPVVRISLQPKSAADLPKMVEALRRLAKTCPIVETSVEDNGKHVLAACGQEHMRVLKRDLEEEYLPGVEVKWDDPSISYRETVTQESSLICLSKSPNKHNRLFIKAEPLDEELCRAIETNQINPNQDAKLRAKRLEKDFGWDRNDGLKIWGFGPAPEEAGGSYGANLLVDQTRAIQYLNEIKESVNSGLLWAARQGPLCEENMRGIRFNLLDVKLHTDSIHRGMGQIQPTARRVFFASTMTAECRFQEPIFNISIGASADSQPGIMQALGACRGEFISCETSGTQINVLAYVPIAETLGQTPFATVLSQKTNGRASANYAFDHWETMNADPLSFKKNKMGEMEPQSKAAEILLAIRKRKGLKVEPPTLAEYFDKL